MLKLFALPATPQFAAWMDELARTDVVLYALPVVLAAAAIYWFEKCGRQLDKFTVRSE